MHRQVSPQPWLGARPVPFLTGPGPQVAVLAPERCACGEPLDLEMERDLGQCCNCQAEAAGVSNGGRG